MSDEHTLRLLDIRARLKASFSRRSEFEKDCTALDAAIAALGGVGEPVAWLYALEYGGIVADTKVSRCQLNYPFGVCGSDYLARNDDGVSYVRQTPLYARPAPPSKEG